MISWSNGTVVYVVITCQRVIYCRPCVSCSLKITRSRTQTHKVSCHPKSIQSGDIYGQIEHYIIWLCRSVGGHQWNAAGKSRGCGPWLSSWKINRVSLLQFQISCTHFPHSSSSHKPSGSVVNNCILCLRGRGHRLRLHEGCTDIKILVMTALGNNLKI